MKFLKFLISPIIISFFACSSNNKEIIQVDKIEIVDSSLLFKCYFEYFPQLKSKKINNLIYSTISVNENFWQFDKYTLDGLISAINIHKDSLSKESFRNDILINLEPDHFKKWGPLDDISLYLFSFDEMFLTIKFYFDGDRGGVSWHTENYTMINLLTEEKVRLEDIFQTNYINKFSNKIIRENINTELNCLYDDWIPLSNIFYFNQNSITFVYNKYDISCGADGLIEVEIPFYKIDQYLRSDFKLNYFKQSNLKYPRRIYNF